MKKIFFLVGLSVIFAVVLGACNFELTAKDPCLPPQLEDQVDQVHKLMRAFDDTTRVIANTPRNQINDGIVKLQAIRREAEDLEVPVCLIALKTYELAHMNAMIETLIAFMGQGDVIAVNTGIAKARSHHEKYNAELARLLGITPAATPSLAPTLVTPVAATPAGEICAPKNISAEVERTNQIMRAFDDWSQIAISTPKEKLQDVIANLQAIRRKAQDNAVSGCLLKLKNIQLEHMETVIATLLSFMSGSDAALVNQGILQARSVHDQYNAEVAFLMGVELIAPVTSTAVVDLSQEALNPGTSPVNIRQSADEKAAILDQLAAGATIKVLGRTPDGTWVWVELPGKPGQVGWILASLLTIPDPAALPQITP